MEMFCAFCVEFGCWEKERGDLLRVQWLNLLLPGVVPYPEQCSLPLDSPERVIVPEHDCETLFREVLNLALAPEHWSNFVLVPSRSKYPLQCDGMQVWGYIREYSDNKHHCRILTLQIREDVFCELAKSLTPVSCDWYKIIKALRERAPSYLLESRTVRMPGIGNAERTLILSVDRLKDIVSQDALNFLLRCYLPR